MNRATTHRAVLTERGREVVGYHESPDGLDTPEPITNADVTRDQIEEEAEILAARRGPDVAQQFLSVALSEGMSIAEGVRRWLTSIAGKNRVSTIKGHEAAFGKLEAYLREKEGWPSLEGVGLQQITRRLAGDFLAHCGERTSVATVKREASAYNGLWRWAMRRGHVDLNPWADQTGGLSAPRVATDIRDAPERGYTSAELVVLLSAGADDLAPNGGGYAATFWDLIRLSLLTGARPGELLGLRIMDVIQNGTAIALAATPRGGKTKNARRIVPLHRYAAQVVSARLAGLADRSTEAPLFPEVPIQGGDGSRTKTISTRFVVIRKRILPASEGVDLYSLRRSFLTAAETAKNARGRLDDGLIARLAGHGQGHLALDVYSDWSRLGRPELTGELAVRLARIAEAVDDMAIIYLTQ
jgi:integrase